MLDTMEVYLVMCDTPRTDLDNVDSAYAIKKEAEDRRDFLNKHDTWNTWHVETLEVYVHD